MNTELAANVKGAIHDCANVNLATKKKEKEKRKKRKKRKKERKKKETILSSSGHSRQSIA